jgi:hypothetical protein
MATVWRYVLIFIFITGMSIQPLFQTYSQEEEQVLEEEWPKFTIGPVIGGGGILGLNGRGEIGERMSAGISGIYRPTYIVVSSPFEDEEISGGAVMVPLEFVYWISEELREKKGPKRHGILLCAGQSFGDYPETMAALAWDYERYKKRKHIFNTSLGVAYFVLTSEGEDNIKEDAADKLDTIPEYIDLDYTETVGLYFKLAWRW